ncbi:helix-turn-helix domain-containing protein [Chryseosolibacter indicus]|uniref:Helix-turn-helix domain-containing protein n=1 Tax=Chryseosolibacter indicus TaxID=2782351 RepID=A0ABS5VRB5_9BACT|nr:helix-turn-helix transcriptional regulator [Chryseosolibacter indicus]MBT1703968.1 helix-turn-helix domain-containing protein [Chryseosolibacter indicus]
MKTRPLKNVLEQIGLKLQGLREKKGYDSIKDFALDHDLPLIQYWRIEKGKANITIKSLNKLLSIHSMSVEDFFCSTFRN